jgi:hypothetical protein
MIAQKGPKAIFRMNAIASVVRRSTPGGLALMRSSGSIGKSVMAA